MNFQQLRSIREAARRNADAWPEKAGGPAAATPTCPKAPRRLDFATPRPQPCAVAPGPGEVSEWLKEHAWKVCKRLNRASGVRIPLSPPDS